MYIIAGLGNPEKKYDGTRHNVGFRVIDALSEKNNIDLTELKFHGVFGKGRIGNEKVILVKPLTYMNLSGDCIREITDYFKVDVNSELIIISDDIDQDTGNIRIRIKGSAGGHNGLKSIISRLGTDEFIRIRVGVGHKTPGMDLADYVLGHFDPEGLKLINESINTASEAAAAIIDDGATAAMNTYNGKKTGNQSSDPVRTQHGGINESH